VPWVPQRERLENEGGAISSLIQPAIRSRSSARIPAGHARSRAGRGFRPLTCVRGGKAVDGDPGGLGRHCRPATATARGRCWGRSESSRSRSHAPGSMPPRARGPSAGAARPPSDRHLAAVSARLPRAGSRQCRSCRAPAPPSSFPAAIIGKSPRSQRLSTSRNVRILRSCHAVPFIAPLLFGDKEDRTTRVLTTLPAILLGALIG
jgi:hypothetical protein